MTLDIPAAIEDGLSRLLTRVAAILLVAYLVVGVTSTITGQTLGLALLEWLRETVLANGAAGMPPEATPAGGLAAQSPLAFEMPLEVAAGLFLAQVVFAQAVGVVAVRTFASDARSRFPSDLDRRFGWVLVNALVAGFVVNVLTVVGTVFLIVPGIYVAVALYFVRFEVIVEDKGVVDALRDGWDLTSGERLPVFFLLVAIVAIGLLSAVPGLVLGSVGVPPLAVTAVSLVVGAVTGLAAVAIGARAYVQLKEPTPHGEDSLYKY
jgi:hypothetical protein